MPSNYIFRYIRIKNTRNMTKIYIYIYKYTNIWNIKLFDIITIKFFSFDFPLFKYVIFMKL